MSKTSTSTQSKTMEQRAIQALNATWQAIAGDTLQCVADNEGKDVNSVSIPKAEVIEVCLDAGYALMYGRDKEAVEWLYKLPYEEQEAIGTKAFRHSRYGT